MTNSAVLFLLLKRNARNVKQCLWCRVCSCESYELFLEAMPLIQKLEPGRVIASVLLFLVLKRFRMHLAPWQKLAGGFNILAEQIVLKSCTWRNWKPYSAICFFSTFSTPNQFWQSCRILFWVEKARNMIALCCSRSATPQFSGVYNICSAKFSNHFPVGAIISTLVEKVIRDETLTCLT